MNPLTEQNADFRYGVYTRKSSEYEDSQIQSIQRQIDELSDVIDREGLLRGGGRGARPARRLAGGREEGLVRLPSYHGPARGGRAGC